MVISKQSVGALCALGFLFGTFNLVSAQAAEKGKETAVRQKSGQVKAGAGKPEVKTKEQKEQALLDAIAKKQKNAPSAADALAASKAKEKENKKKGAYTNCGGPGQFPCAGN